MNDTEQIYIQLVASGINETHGEINFSKVQLEQLVSLCKLHRNAGIVYHGLIKQENVPQNMIEVFEKGFYTEMMIYSKRMIVFQMVLDALNRQKIKHIIVKGMSYAKCYPQTEFRTMGDLDLIICENDIQRADNVLEELGGQLNYESSNQKIHHYILRKYHIELHTSIGYAGRFYQAYNYETYFQAAIQNSVCIDGYTYEFAPYYKVIYGIFHIAKHFYESGCGVRMLTDVAVLMKYYKSQIDMERLWKDLEAMRLKEFAQNLFSICREWFGLETDGLDSSLKNKDIVEEYILSGGVFGHDNDLGDAMQIGMQNGKYRYIKIFKWAFPGYRHMREYSQWFKDKPAILLPIAYMERFIRNARERGGIAAWIKQLKKANREKKVQENILKSVGLSNELLGE